MGMPTGEGLLDTRDRLSCDSIYIVRARLATGCRLEVSDFHREGESATIRLHEKGDKRRTIGCILQQPKRSANTSKLPASPAVPYSGLASNPGARN